LPDDDHGQAIIDWFNHDKPMEPLGAIGQSALGLLIAEGLRHIS